jgi:hypothetical protein
MPRTGLHCLDPIGYCSDMDRRRVTEQVAENISNSILSAGTDTSTIARAAGMDPATLESRLIPEDEMTVGELVRVGSALHVSPGSLLAGVAA